MSSDFNQKIYLLQYEKFTKKFPILINNLDQKVLESFLRIYNKTLFYQLDIFINEILYDCRIIDFLLFKKLSEENYSVYDLALTTDIELAQKLNISLRIGRIIKILAEFHYSIVFGEMTVYYIHPKEHCNEIKEIETIKRNFPFAKVIVFSKLNNLENQNLIGIQISNKCLDVFEKADLIIFSPFNEKYINKGTYDEIHYAEKMKKPIYLIKENELLNYLFLDKNYKSDENFCSYKPIAIKNNMIINEHITISLENFFKTNFNDILCNIKKNKKYMILCSSTYDIQISLNILLIIFKQFNLKILPILGKKPLCIFQNNNLDCINCEYYKKKGINTFFDNLKQQYIENLEKNIITAIKRSTPVDLCSYDLIYQNIRDSNIILINKIFFQSIRLRFKLNEKIFSNEFNKFILVFNNNLDLNLPYKEGKCSKNALKRIKSFITNNEISGKNKAINLIDQLIALGTNGIFTVDIFLKDFLESNFKIYRDKLGLYLEPFEEVYEICKSPFGIWTNSQDMIIQKIDNNSFYNYLNNFEEIYFLENKEAKIGG